MARQKAFVKTHAEIIAKLAFLEREILGNTRLSVYQKQNHIAWREALVWVITEEKHAWKEALAKMYGSSEYAKLEKSAKKHDGTANRDETKA